MTQYDIGLLMMGEPGRKFTSDDLIEKFGIPRARIVSGLRRLTKAKNFHKSIEKDTIVYWYKKDGHTD